MADKLKVLYIEDNAEVSWAIETSLANEGCFEVISVSNLQQARVAFIAENPDVVWTDHDYPKDGTSRATGCGFEMIEFVRQSNRPRTPIIWYSGSVDVEPRDAIAKGADHAFTKPCYNEVLSVLMRMKAELKQQTK